MTWFFTSDEHYGHEKIINYCHRPFGSVEEMNETLIANHNSVVTKHDTTVHLGDFGWFKKKDQADKVIHRLNGNHIFLKGSHDRWLPDSHKTQWRRHINGRFIVCCHYAFRTWERARYGAINLYGHCLDVETEILTEDGWKGVFTIHQHDKPITMNVDTRELEVDSIQEMFFIPAYFGDMVSLKAKGIDCRVSANHTMVYRALRSDRIDTCAAIHITKSQTRVFIKAGVLKRPPADVTKNEIRLLVWMAADGNLCNTDLMRIRVAKKRKIARIKDLLDVVGIQYSQNSQKDGSVCFNFTIPAKLLAIGVKPLSRIVTTFNREQALTVVEEYTHTDGYKNAAANLIYTSKKCEADAIQHMCVVNGLMCNISERRCHGFSRLTSYELCITNRTARRHVKLGQRVRIEPTTNETIWCVSTRNGTLLTRRHGKPLVTGNSHGTLPGVGKQMDVGVDCNNFYPFSLDEILERMSGVEMLREDDHATQALSRAELIRRQKDVAQYNLNAEEQRVYDEQFDEASHPDPEKPE